MNQRALCLDMCDHQSKRKGLDMNDPLQRKEETCCDHWPAKLTALVRMAAVWGVLAAGLIACGKQLAPTNDAPPPTFGQLRPVRSAPDVATRNPATQDFMTNALNALLVPLLDDDWPPRWADPSQSFDCDAGQVTVDSAAVDVGAPVQQGKFTVRWHMQRCVPFDNHLELSGDIELQVESSDHDFSAFVHPVGLRVLSMYGEEVLNESFVRHMRIDR